MPNPEADPKFRERVYYIVSHIPRGKVMSYGQVAAMAGQPRAARIVGGIAHFGDTGLPWQRVVMKDGSLATGFPGGVTGHKEALDAEQVSFTSELRVDMAKHQWFPR